MCLYIEDSSSATNSDSDTDSENIFYSTYHESKLYYVFLFIEFKY